VMTSSLVITHRVGQTSSILAIMHAQGFQGRYVDGLELKTYI